MPKITFIAADGVVTVVDAQVGRTIMETAIGNGIGGILGDCGGQCNCATCHVYVTGASRDRLPPVSSIEDAMLSGVIAERRPESRLSCEIVVKPEYEGLIIHLPDRQL